MKTKGRKIYAALIALLGLCLLGLLFLIVMPHNGGTASAAGTPRYNIYFDYKYYSGSHMGTVTPTPNLVAEKTNVLKSDEHLYKFGKKCQVEFEIYGSYYDDTTGTLPQGGTIKSKEVTIVAISEFEGNFFTIKDASGNVVAKNTISYGTLALRYLEEHNPAKMWGIVDLPAYLHGIDRQAEEMDEVLRKKLLQSDEYKRTGDYMTDLRRLTALNKVIETEILSELVYV